MKPWHLALVGLPIFVVAFVGSVLFPGTVPGTTGTYLLLALVPWAIARSRNKNAAPSVDHDDEAGKRGLRTEDGSSVLSQSISAGFFGGLVGGLLLVGILSIFIPESAVWGSYFFLFLGLGGWVAFRTYRGELNKSDYVLSRSSLRARLWAKIILLVAVPVGLSATIAGGFIVAPDPVDEPDSSYSEEDFAEFDEPYDPPLSGELSEDESSHETCTRELRAINQNPSLTEDERVKLLEGIQDDGIC